MRCLIMEQESGQRLPRQRTCAGYCGVLHVFHEDVFEAMQERRDRQFTGDSTLPIDTHDVIVVSRAGAGCGAANNFGRI